MKISKYKVTIAVLAMALGTSLVSAQTGTQTPPPAKKPSGFDRDEDTRRSLPDRDTTKLFLLPLC